MVWILVQLPKEIHTIDFPSKQVGHPDGVETMSHVDISSFAKVHKSAMESARAHLLSDLAVGSFVITDFVNTR